MSVEKSYGSSLRQYIFPFIVHLLLDHRIKQRFELAKILDGQLEENVAAVMAKDQEAALLQLMENEQQQ